MFYYHSVSSGMRIITKISTLVMMILITSIASSSSSLVSSSTFVAPPLFTLRCGTTTADNINRPDAVAIIAADEVTNNEFTEANPCPSLVIRNSNFLAIRFHKNSVNDAGPRLGKLRIENSFVGSISLTSYPSSSSSSFVSVSDGTTLPEIEIIDTTINFDGATDYRSTENQPPNSSIALSIHQTSSSPDISTSSPFSSIIIEGCNISCISNPDLTLFRNESFDALSRPACVSIGSLSIASSSNNNNNNNRNHLKISNNNIQTAYGGLLINDVVFTNDSSTTSSIPAGVANDETAQLTIIENVIDHNEASCSSRTACTPSQDDWFVVQLRKIKFTAPRSSTSMRFPSSSSSNENSNNNNNNNSQVLVHSNVIHSTTYFPHKDVSDSCIEMRFVDMIPFILADKSSSTGDHTRILAASNRPFIVTNNTINVDASRADYRGWNGEFVNFADIDRGDAPGANYNGIRLHRCKLSTNNISISYNTITILRIGNPMGISMDTGAEMGANIERRWDLPGAGFFGGGQVLIDFNIFNLSTYIPALIPNPLDSSNPNAYRSIRLYCVLFDPLISQAQRISMSNNIVLEATSYRPAFVFPPQRLPIEYMLPSSMGLARIMDVFNVTEFEISGNELRLMRAMNHERYIASIVLVTVTGARTFRNVDSVTVENNIMYPRGGAQITILAQVDLPELRSAISKSFVVRNNSLDLTHHRDMTVTACALCASPLFASILPPNLLQFMDTQAVSIFVFTSSGSELVVVSNNRLVYNLPLVVDPVTGEDRPTISRKVQISLANWITSEIKSVMSTTRRLTLEVAHNKMRGYADPEANVFSQTVHPLKQMPATVGILGLGAIVAPLQLTAAEQNAFFFPLNLTLVENEMKHDAGRPLLMMFGSVHFAKGSFINVSNNLVKRVFANYNETTSTSSSAASSYLENVLSSSSSSATPTSAPLSVEEKAAIVQRLLFDPMSTQFPSAMAVNPDDGQITIKWTQDEEVLSSFIQTTSLKFEDGGIDVTVRISNNRIFLPEFLESSVVFIACVGRTLDFSKTDPDGTKNDPGTNCFHTGDSMIQGNIIEAARPAIPIDILEWSSMKQQTDSDGNQPLTLKRPDVVDFIVISNQDETEAARPLPKLEGGALSVFDNRLHFVSYDPRVIRRGNPTSSRDYELEKSKNFVAAYNFSYSILRIAHHSSTLRQNNINNKNDMLPLTHFVVENNTINFTFAERSSIVMTDTTTANAASSDDDEQDNQFYIDIVGNTIDRADVFASDFNRRRGSFSFLDVFQDEKEASMTTNDPTQETTPPSIMNLKLKSNKVYLKIRSTSQTAVYFDEKFVQSWISVFNNYSSSSDTPRNHHQFVNLDISSSSASSSSICNQILVDTILTSSQSRQVVLGLARGAILSSSPSIVRSPIDDTGCFYQVQFVNSSNDELSKTTSKSLSNTDLVPRFVLANGVVSASPLVNSLLAAGSALQTTSTVFSAMAAVSSPSFGFSVGRNQGMLNFAKKALSGDCRGLFPVIVDEENMDADEKQQLLTNANDNDKKNPRRVIAPKLTPSESPTQLSVGSSKAKYFVGAIFGNFIFTFGVCILTLVIGYCCMKIYAKKVNKKNSSSSSIIPVQQQQNEASKKLSSGRMRQKAEQGEDTMKINNSNEIPSLPTSNELVYAMAQSFMSLTFFFAMSILIAPTLSSTLIVLIAISSDEVAAGLKAGIAIVCLIFCFAASYFVIWSTFLRQPRNEEYKLLAEDDNEKKENEKKDVIKNEKQSKKKAHNKANKSTIMGNLDQFEEELLAAEDKKKNTDDNNNNNNNKQASTSRGSFITYFLKPEGRWVLEGKKEEEDPKISNYQELVESVSKIKNNNSNSNSNNKKVSNKNNSNSNNSDSNDSSNKNKKNSDQQMEKSSSPPPLRDYLCYIIAEPTFESYRSTVWFGIVELATVIAVAFPPVFAQLASTGKSSCIVQGVLLLLILVIYTILLIWKNPAKLRIARICLPILSVQQSLSVLLVLITVFMTPSENDINSIGSSPQNENSDSSSSSNDPSGADWLWSLLMVSVISQTILGMFLMVASFFPILKFIKKIMMRVNRVRKNNSNNKNNNKFNGEDNYDDDDEELLEFSTRRRGNSRYSRDHFNHHDRDRDHRRRHSSSRHKDDRTTPTSSRRFSSNYHHYDDDRDRRGSRPRNSSFRRDDDHRDYNRHHDHHDRRRSANNNSTLSSSFRRERSDLRSPPKPTATTRGDHQQKILSNNNSFNYSHRGDDRNRRDSTFKHSRNNNNDDDFVVDDYFRNHSFRSESFRNDSFRSNKDYRQRHSNNNQNPSLRSPTKSMMMNSPSSAAPRSPLLFQQQEREPQREGSSSRRRSNAANLLSSPTSTSSFSRDRLSPSSNNNKDQFSSPGLNNTGRSSGGGRNYQNWSSERERYEEDDRKRGRK